MARGREGGAGRRDNGREEGREVVFDLTTAKHGGYGRIREG